MSEEEKPVKIPFRVSDFASRAIEKIAEKTEKLSEHVDEAAHKLLEMGSALTGIAGGLGFEKMIETGRESLEQISKLAKLTGTTGDNIAAMRDLFEQSGLSAEQLGMTMTALSKKALAAEEGGKGILREAQAWGIELNKGPVKAFESLAKSVQQHKIDAAGVAKLTRTSSESAGAMMEILEKGPEELHSMIEHAKKLNVALSSPEAFEQFAKFHEASEKVHQSFRRISEKVIIALAPALSKMADKFSTWIDGINVHKFIDPLVHGMEMVVKHAQALGKIMAANSILMKTTGSGLTGTALSVGKSAFGIGAKVFGKVGAGIGENIALASKGGPLASLGGALGGIVGPLMRVIGGVTGLGVVAAAIYLVIKHLDYFKEKLGGVARAIWSSIKKLWDSLSSVFSEESSIGKFVRWVGDNFMSYLQFAGTMVSKLIDLVATAIEWISAAIDAVVSGKNIHGILADKAQERREANLKKTGYDKYLGGENREQVLAITKLIEGNKTLTSVQIDFYRKFMEAGKAMGYNMDNEAYGKFRARYGAVEAERKAPDASAAASAGVVQDFRGSRFEIEQKFAEGFDPDRIAVGFANDIASLGEKRLASGYSPINAVR